MPSGKATKAAGDSAITSAEDRNGEKEREYPVETSSQQRKVRASEPVFRTPQTSHSMLRVRNQFAYQPSCKWCRSGQTRDGAEVVQIPGTSAIYEQSVPTVRSEV